MRRIAASRSQMLLLTPFFFFIISDYNPLLHVSAFTLHTNPQSFKRRLVRDGKHLFVESSKFENNGPFNFMSDFLEKGGIQEGKKITWGVIAQDIDAADVGNVSEEEALQRRKVAAEKLVNIDAEERARRDKVGSIVMIFAVVYAAYISIVVDAGDVAGHFMRFSVFPFAALGYGYKQSAKEGL